MKARHLSAGALVFGLLVAPLLAIDLPFELTGLPKARGEPLISGEALVEQAIRRADETEDLLQIILQTGVFIEVGDPKAERLSTEPSSFALVVPIRVKPIETTLAPLLAKLGMLLGLKDQPRRLRSVQGLYPYKGRLEATSPIRLSKEELLYIYAARGTEAVTNVLKRFQDSVLTLDVHTANTEESCLLDFNDTPPHPVWVGFGAQTIRVGEGDNLIMGRESLPKGQQPNFVAFRERFINAEVRFNREHLDHLVNMSASFRHGRGMPFSDTLECRILSIP